MDENRSNFPEPKALGGSVYSAPESEEHDIHARHYLLAVLNRRWMILTIVFLVVGITAIYSFVQTPTYRAKAVVDIDLPGMYIMLPDAASQPLYLKNESLMNTQFRVLQSKNLSKRVAEKLNLSMSDLAEGGFSKRLKNLTPVRKSDQEIDLVASKLLGMVKIAPVQRTNLCEIVFTTPDPRLSAELANGWAQEYVRQRLDSMQQYTRRAEELLMEQVKGLRDDIEQQEKQLHTYSLEKQILRIDKTRTFASEALTTVNGALNEATRERLNAQVKYQALQSSAYETIPEVINSQSYVAAEKLYADLQRQYSEKSKTYKVTYPEMVRLRDDMEAAKIRLQTTAAQVYKNLLASARSEAQEASIKEGALRKQLEDAKRQSVETGSKELDYDQIQMEIDTKKQLLTMLLQKHNQTDVSAQVQEKTTTATRIIESAEIPKTIFQPDIKKNILFSLIAGFIGSIMLALLLDYFDRSLKTPEDVERHLHLPFFGMVPHYVPDEGHNGHKNGSKALATQTSDAAIDRYVPYRLSMTDTGSSASEAMKTVRTSLLLAFPGAPPRSILVTSSRAGEGKTFVSSNLAIALTQLDKRVVVVDGDMRNPHVHRVWNIDNSTGLSIYLTSDVDVDSVMRPSPVSRLFVITSGPKTPRPAELLASARFEELIRQLEKDFDFVIVDSPPVLPVADSVILASRVKGILIVVRGGSTPRDIVKMAKKKLSASNGIIAGTVLNGIDLADPYYYYRYYTDYYSSYYGKSQQNGDGQGDFSA